MKQNKKKGTVRILILVIFFVVVSSEFSYAVLSSEKSSTEFLNWFESSTWGSSDAYFIPKNAIVANTRENVIKAYNYVVSNNGQFNKKKLTSNYNCSVLRGWSIGRIIESKKDSNVVKIQYIPPLTGGKVYVVEDYVVVNMITPLGEYMKSLAK